MASSDFSSDAPTAAGKSQDFGRVLVSCPIETVSREPSSIPIPVPRRKAMDAIDGVVKVMGGDAIPVFSSWPEQMVGYRLPGLGLTILGTGCRRPLLFEEARDLRSLNGDHMLIVRMEDEAHGFGPFTLDLLMHGTEFWLTRYRLWQIHPTADMWMVPSQGEGRSIRIVGGYLAVSPRAPFYNVFEREHGFATAAKVFNRAQGAI